MHVGAHMHPHMYLHAEKKNTIDETHCKGEELFNDKSTGYQNNKQEKENILEIGVSQRYLMKVEKLV